MTNSKYTVEAEAFEELSEAIEYAQKLANEKLDMRSGVTSRTLEDCTVCVRRDDNTVAATVRPR